MRNYSRVFHTSLDHLAEMPLSRLMAELADAAIDLSEENRRNEQRMKKEQAKAKSRYRARPKHRRR